MTGAGVVVVVVVEGAAVGVAILEGNRERACEGRGDDTASGDSVLGAELDSTAGRRDGIRLKIA